MRQSSRCLVYKMNLYSVIGIGLVATILSVLVKQTRPEQAVLISLAAGCLIFGFVLSQVRDLISWWEEVATEFGAVSTYVAPLIKILGITYLTQFASQACRDAGENAVALKLELAGKVVVLGLSVPILKMILELIKNILS